MTLSVDRREVAGVKRYKWRSLPIVESRFLCGVRRCEALVRWCEALVRWCEARVR
jgi:hypothetical protein